MVEGLGLNMTMRLLFFSSWFCYCILVVQWRDFNRLFSFKNVI